MLFSQERSLWPPVVKALMRKSQIIYLAPLLNNWGCCQYNQQIVEDFCQYTFAMSDDFLPGQTRLEVSPNFCEFREGYLVAGQTVGANRECTKPASSGLRLLDDDFSRKPIRLPQNCNLMLWRGAGDASQPYTFELSPLPSELTRYCVQALGYNDESLDITGVLAIARQKYALDIVKAVIDDGVAVFHVPAISPSNKLLQGGAADVLNTVDLGDRFRSVRIVDCAL